MKASLITPTDIKYTGGGTERHVYEYAKYLKQHGIDTEILITENIRGYSQSPYRNLSEDYKAIPKREISCNEFVLPFKWHLFIYKRLPRSGTIYMPFSVYDYIVNIVRKPKGQKYIIGCHGMHLKGGHIIASHNIIERLLNSQIRFLLSIRPAERRNVYYHALNSVQAEYLTVLGVSRKNIFFIPDMVACSGFRINRNRSKRLRVLHIGGFSKEPGKVVGIIKELKRRGQLDRFKFCFVGSEHLDEADALAQKHKNVVVAGKVSDREKLKIMGESDVMIVPGYETFSIALLEGLASGLYAITSPKCGSAEYLRTLGIKLSIVKSSSANEYADVLSELSTQKENNPMRFNPDKEANRRIVLKEFDTRVVLPKILKMFIVVGK